MKKMALFLMAAAFTSFSFAQLRKIPAEVTDAFKAKYPNAEKVEWSDKLSSFEASFKNGSDELKAYFTSKGEWKNTEKELGDKEVPAAVQESLDKSKYADWEVKSQTEITKADGKVEYRIVVKKSAVEKKNLYFSNDGQLLKDPLTI